MGWWFLLFLAHPPLCLIYPFDRFTSNPKCFRSGSLTCFGLYSILLYFKIVPPVVWWDLSLPVPRAQLWQCSLPDTSQLWEPGVSNPCAPYPYLHTSEVCHRKGRLLISYVATGPHSLSEAYHIEQRGKSVFIVKLIVTDISGERKSWQLWYIFQILKREVSTCSLWQFSSFLPPLEGMMLQEAAFEVQGIIFFGGGVHGGGMIWTWLNTSLGGSLYASWGSHQGVQD